jgi:hypothetical protein
MTATAQQRAPFWKFACAADMAPSADDGCLGCCLACFLALLAAFLADFLEEEAAAGATLAALGAAAWGTRWACTQHGCAMIQLNSGVSTHGDVALVGYRPSDTLPC